MATDVAAAILTHTGLEDSCAKEVETILGARPTVLPGMVRCAVPLDALCDFCYRTRSALRVVIVLGERKAADIMLGATALAETVDVTGWLDGTTSFACRSTVPDIGTELAAEVGGILNDRTTAPVDLARPSTTILVFSVEDTVLVGIDMTGDTLGKRDYRIFLGNDSLRGTLAYGLLATAGYDGSQTLADVFCRSGIIPIEAALLATGIAPHKHARDFLFRRMPSLQALDWEARFDTIDKRLARDPTATIIAMDDNFGAVAAAKKNAKIAGVNTALGFSRTDLQFLDAKFGKAGLDMIVTMPPQPNARNPAAYVDKALAQLFYQAEFILKKKGKLALLTRTNVASIKALADKYKLMLLSERPVWQGGLELRLLVFTK